MFQVTFFMLPILLMFGVAVQGLGVLILGLILPVIFLKIDKPKPLRMLSLSLFSFYLIPMIFNWIHGSSFRAFNPMSLSVSVFGFFIFIKSFFPAPWLLKNSVGFPESESFIKGVLVASILFLIPASIQLIWGLNLKGGVLLSQEIMPSGFYRVRGWYGHPLSLGCVSLAIYLFFLARSLQTSLSRLHLGIIASQFLMISMSGSRSILVIALLLTFILVLMRRSWKIVWLILGMSVVGYITGLYVKLIDSFTRFYEQGIFDASDLRSVIWKVYVDMWRDSPWFGHGFVQVKETVRQLHAQNYGLTHSFSAHNQYLEILAGSGIVGLVLFAIASVFLFIQIIALNRTFAFPFLFAVSGNLLVGFVQNAFFDTSVTYIYLGLLSFMIFTKPKKS